MRLHKSLIFILSVVFLLAVTISAQHTNPVEKKVADPLTDQPNVNPIAPEQDIKAPKTKQTSGYKQEGGDGDLVVYSKRHTVEGEDDKRVVVHSGDVDARYGIYRMQADKITVYEAQTRIVAEGNVVFDQGDDQRITGSTGEFNYTTKLGFFVESTGFTNQTNDGTVIYFTADRVERVGENEVVVINGKFTACEENVPKWSFTAGKAIIKPDDKIKLINANSI